MYDVGARHASPLLAMAAREVRRIVEGLGEGWNGPEPGVVSVSATRGVPRTSRFLRSGQWRRSLLFPWNHYMRTRCITPSLALSLLSLPVAAQAVRVGAPTATLSEEFSDIRGVRELRDGRILVSDYIDQRVVLVDLRTGSVSDCLTEGIGPQDVRLAGRLIPMPGDSTLLVDIGNGRLMVLDPTGTPRRVISGERPGVMGTRGVTADGSFYFSIPGWAEQENALPNDSVRIVRWNPRSNTTQLVAVVQGDRMRSDQRTPALTPRIPIVGYASYDGWTVADDGALRIVRGGNYVVESRGGTGAAVVGPSHVYTTRAVTAADRTAFVRDFNRSSPTSGRGTGGSMGFSPAMSDAEVAAMVRGTEYAERHPMFRPGSIVTAPGGRLWVGRPPEASRPVLYDVFDAAGRRVQQVEFPAGRRVLSIGRGGIYVATEDADGVQKVERYATPR
jgi:hypothetical protein